MGLALLVGSALAAVWLNRKEQLPPLISEEDLRIMRDTAANGEQVGTESKLFEKPYVLKTGRPVEAARGLENRMNVMQEHLAEQAAKGVEGIQMEVDRFVGDSTDPEVKEVGELLRYIRFENTSEKEYPNGIRDKGRGSQPPEYFLMHPKAQQACLIEAEVVALRLYTTMAYKFMNNPLRDQDRHLQGIPCPLAVTTWWAVSGIKKLRALSELSDTIKESKADIESMVLSRDQPASRWLRFKKNIKIFPSSVNIDAKFKASGDLSDGPTILWRGMRNVDIADKFMDEGGTELAFMSTTTNLEVAVRYSLSRQSLLLKIVSPNFMTTGAELQWLSAFPGEAEILYPPLTYLKPTGRTDIVWLEKNGEKLSFKVVEVNPQLA